MRRCGPEHLLEQFSFSLETSNCECLVACVLTASQKEKAASSVYIGLQVAGAKPSLHEAGSCGECHTYRWPPHV